MAAPGQRAEPHPLIIDSYLQVLLEQVASDLVLTAGAPPNMRKDGGLVPIGRASCRERVEISVVAVSLKKKKEHRLRDDFDYLVGSEDDRAVGRVARWR